MEQMQKNNRTQSRLALYLPVILLLACIIAGMMLTPLRGADFLFSEEDAGFLRYSGAEWEQMLRAEEAEKSLEPKKLTVGAKEEKGPVIELLVPEVKKDEVVTLTPTDFHLRFIETDNPVDMSSLRIIGRKFMLTKDITESLAPFIEGQQVLAKAVAIPSGKFVLDIEVADTRGVISKRRYKLIVKKG